MRATKYLDHVLVCIYICALNNAVPFRNCEMQLVLTANHLFLKVLRVHPFIL